MIGGLTCVVSPLTAQPAVALRRLIDEGAQSWLNVSHEVLCELCRDSSHSAANASVCCRKVTESLAFTSPSSLIN